MNKIDFPTGVELPLRGGGKAILAQFLNGCWQGWRTDKSGARRKMNYTHWSSTGRNITSSADDIMWPSPPKRTVWLVWRDGFGVPAAYLDKTDALELVRELGGLIQEIERP